MDARFPDLLRALRLDHCLSLRELARLVHYSHSYLWDLETGRKPPSQAIAQALDSVLSADGMLAELAVHSARHEPVDPTPCTRAMRLLDDSRPHLVEISRLSRSAHADAAIRATAAQWAQVAGWLYDVFVRERPPLVRSAALRYSRRIRRESGLSPFRVEVSKQGRSPHAECRSVTRQPAPPEVAIRLMIEPDDLVVRRENRYYADGEPVQRGVTYIPVSVAGSDSRVTMRALGRGALYSRLEDLGYEVARISEQVSTRLPTAEESAILRIPPGVPVLEVMHTSYDIRRRPFEVTCFTIRADLTVLDNEMAVCG